MTSTSNSKQLLDSLYWSMGSWTLHSQGRPTTDIGAKLISKLIHATKEGRVSPYPPDSFFPLSDVISHPSDISTVDLWSLVTNDINAGAERIKIYDGRDSPTPITIHAIWPSLMNAGKSVLGPQDAFAAVVDAHGSPQGFGSLSIRFPPGLPFKDYVSLDNNGESCPDIIVGTAITPTGWFTPPHYDYEGGLSILAHLSGSKIWITYPRSEHNREIMEPTAEHAFNMDNVDFLQVFDQLEEVSCHVFRDPVAFLLSPFEYHSCLCLETTMHIGGPAWCKKHLGTICKELNGLLDRWQDEVKKDKEIRREAKVKLSSVITPLLAVSQVGGKDSKHKETVNKLKLRVNRLR